MDKPVYLPDAGKTIIVKGKRPSHLMTGILPSAVDATQGIPTKAGINNLDDLFAAGALQGEQTTKEMEDFGTGVVEFAKEHPVSLATGLVGGALLPVTIPGMLAMGGIGAGSELADAKIRGEDVSAKDLALAAGIQGLTHGILGRAPVEGINGEQALIEAVTARGPIRQFEETPRYIPAPKEFGHPEGLDILNYDAFPSWAVEHAAELERQGYPRFIKGRERSDYEGKMVGNPIYKLDPNTPEGIEYIDAGGMPNPNWLISGGRSERDLYSMGKTTKLDPNSHPGVFDFHIADKPGYLYKPQWGTPDEILGPGYVRPSHGLPFGDNMMDQLNMFREVGDAIRTGKINENNLPRGYKSVKEVEDVLYGLNPDKAFNTELGRRFLHETGDPRLGSTQEFWYMGSNPFEVDMHGKYWNSYAKMQGIDPHQWQRGAILHAIQNNSDALVFKNMRDPPAYEYGIPEEYIKAKRHHQPIDVHVMIDPREYISPFGLGPIKKQGNPMNLIPLTGMAAGLGYGASQAGNQ